MFFFRCNFQKILISVSLSFLIKTIKLKLVAYGSLEFVTAMEKNECPNLSIQYPWYTFDIVTPKREVTVQSSFGIRELHISSSGIRRIKLFKDTAYWAIKTFFNYSKNKNISPLDLRNK